MGIIAAKERVTLGLIFACMALWVLCGLLWNTAYWLPGLLAMPILAAFHTSLQHETIHGHPTRSDALNELLVSLPLAVVFPYRRYRDLHLRHHNDLNLTDPYEDPESFFWPDADYRLMRPLTRTIFRFNNTFVGRLLVGPALSIVGFARTEIQRLFRREPGVTTAWLLHLASVAAIYVLVTGWFGMPAWVYFLCVVYPAISLTSMRAYAEHQAAENVGARTAVVEAHRAFSLLYLNNNLHIVHHASPLTPWYDLPDLYEERKSQYLAANENTLFHGYKEIAVRFAFRAKQPVNHPYLYRDQVGME